METLSIETQLAQFAEALIASLDKGEPIMDYPELREKSNRIHEGLQLMMSASHQFIEKGVIDPVLKDAVAAWAKQEPTPSLYKFHFRKGVK